MSYYTYLMRGVRRLSMLSLPLAIVSSSFAQPAQTTPPPAGSAAADRPAPTAAEVERQRNRVEEEEPVVLSPFEVQTSASDIGYYASNTLAGSRLNSKIEDLAAPITVVTKQQLEDTASRDLNDVFLYEANTEGSLNYTKIRLDRGGLKDEIGGSATNGIGANTSTTANRVRGLINVDLTWNYYPVIQRVRGDTYNASSLEISRGPNSILAGLGSPAGILNQSIASATIGQNTNEVNLGVGSYGSFRTSLALNRTLVEDKLAIYLAGLYDDRRFARKPSYDLSRRQTGGFTYKPFKGTTIKGFVENFRNDSRLPNQMTPRDGITPWMAAGRPSWDPVTRQVTYLDTGVTTAAYLNSNSELVDASRINATTQVRISGDSILTDRRSSRAVPGLGFVNLGRSTRFINPDGSFFWSQAQATAFNVYPHPTITTSALQAAHVQGVLNGTTGAFTRPTLDPTGPAGNPSGPTPGSPWDIWLRRYSTSALPAAPDTYDFIGGGTYIAPAVNDQRIYDWEKINITATNHGEMRTTTYNLELEQQLAPDLFFSAGWFRQDLDSLENYPLSQLSPVTLLIDTNKNLISGQPNPNYLKPYVDIQDPDTAQTPEVKDVLRAMLAYDLDFSKNDGWSRWLGRHRFLAFAQHEDTRATSYRYRFAFSDPSDPRFLTPEARIPVGTTNGAGPRALGFRYAGNANTSRHAWYVGGNNSLVNSAPSTAVGNPALGTTERSAITAYNYQTGQWEQAPVTYGTEHFDAGGGYQRAQRKVNTVNLTAQSFWLDDRIVTTLGMRRDKWMGRQTTTGADAFGNVLGANGDQINAVLYPTGEWRLREQNLLDRWGRAEFIEQDTGSMGVVIKPLAWLHFHGNRSDNFNPPADARVNLFREKLPVPEGKSKDFGFSLNLLDNKLITRLTIFKTEFIGDRSNGSVGTVIGRVPRQDTSNLRSWAEAVVRLRSNIPGTPEAAEKVHVQAPNSATPASRSNDWLRNDLAPSQLTAGQLAMVESRMGGLSLTWPDGALFGSTQDAIAEGAELEVIYNPTPNWNIKVTAAQQETTYSNIFPDYDKWIAFRKPIWEAAAAPELVGPGTDGTYSQPDGRLFKVDRFWTGYGFGETNIATRQNGANPEDWLFGVVGSELANARQLQGAAPYGQRKYRANMITNYAFSQGFLKNFAIGGAVRWEDKAVIGYRGKMDSRGVWVGVDANRPVYDTDLGVDPLWDLTHFDFWMSYKLKMWSDKIRTKIQLNVTDVFQNGRLSPVFINFDGSPAAYRIVDERRWQLSAKFEF